jgi:A/G-specific adenine glycosylase
VRTDNTANQIEAWFAREQRDLPWRGSDVTAWGVLVSEFMLQQTPAARVIEPYLTWMERWPTPADLAAAAPGDAVRAWANLGYPRRALWLHACATTITNDHGGRVPSSVAELEDLPGIGPYTARAVAVFAYRAHEPVVDTNVRRVIARWHHGHSDQGSPSAKRDHADMLALMPPPAQSPEFNAAMMELGARVCTSKSPRCGDCPISAGCAWRAAGYPDTGARGAARQAKYAGSDRQARGALLAALRASTGPVPQSSLERAWPEKAQRDRALVSLIDDGLVIPLARNRLGLPE